MIVNEAKNQALEAFQERLGRNDGTEIQTNDIICEDYRNSPGNWF